MEVKIYPSRCLVMDFISKENYCLMWKYEKTLMVKLNILKLKQKDVWLNNCDRLVNWSRIKCKKMKIWYVV